MNRRKIIFANRMHRDIFMFIFSASVIPMVLSCVALFYFIFNVTAQQLGFPETIAQNLYPAAKKVILTVFVLTPVVVSAVLVFAYKATHEIVGPYDRIVREMGECIDGTRRGPIVLRKKDKFQPLVDKINILLDGLSQN